MIPSSDSHKFPSSQQQAGLPRQIPGIHASPMLPGVALSHGSQHKAGFPNTFGAYFQYYAGSSPHCGSCLGEGDQGHGRTTSENTLLAQFVTCNFTYGHHSLSSAPQGGRAPGKAPSPEHIPLPPGWATAVAFPQPAHRAVARSAPQCTVHATNGKPSLHHHLTLPPPAGRMCQIKPPFHPQSHAPC
jgi:hypothetical protein